MNYLYEIGYGSPEDSCYHQLWHDEEFSDEGLAQLVAEATIAVIHICKAENNSVHSFSSIHREVAEWLIEYKGFSRAEYKARWSCFGWASIFTDAGWDTYKDDPLIELVEAVRRAGYTWRDDTYIAGNVEDGIANAEELDRAEASEKP